MNGITPRAALDVTPAAVGAGPVGSWTEWDPLEVIVGHVEGATTPSNHLAVTYNLPPVIGRLFRLAAGRRYPEWMKRLARAELDGFIQLLEGEGVTVRRPDPAPFRRSCRTPHWRSRGFTVACPRDGFLVIGDEIIETPMCWRSAISRATPAAAS